MFYVLRKGKQGAAQLIRILLMIKAVLLIIGSFSLPDFTPLERVSKEGGLLAIVQGYISF